MADKIEVSYSQRMDAAEWERFFEEKQEWNLYHKLMGGSDFKVRPGPGYFRKAIMIEGVNEEIYAGAAEGEQSPDDFAPPDSIKSLPIVHLNFLIREDQMDGYSVPGLDEIMEKLDFQPREPRRL